MPTDPRDTVELRLKVLEAYSEQVAKAQRDPFGALNTALEWVLKAPSQAPAPAKSKSAD